jgi:hypothetical protein
LGAFFAFSACFSGDQCETEVNKNIGTIANSGTKKFLKGLDEKQAQDSNSDGKSSFSS